MPSAYSVPIASDVLPDPDTPTTATVRHSGTSTSTSRRLLCRAPRTPMTAGKVPGTGISPAAIPGTLRPSVSGCPARSAPGPALAGPGAVLSGVDRTGGPLSRRSDCMIWKVVVVVKSSMSAAASTPVYLAITGAAARSVTASRWPFTPAQTFSPAAT